MFSFLSFGQYLKNNVLLIVIISLSTMFSGCARRVPYAGTNNSVAEIKICFTPPSNICGDLIVDEISQAQKSIYVQAYGLTHKKIISALTNARAKGVDVKILLDKSNLTQKNSKINQLVSAGIDVKVDKISGIAHNKVMILDMETVITGSYNFTTSADLRNTENVVFIYDPNIASQYFNNWQNRKTHSKEISFRK